MRILVAVSEVTTLADEFVIDGLTIPAEHREYALNEWDEYAVEAAVQLVEADVAEEVVTVTIGPERTEETIRKVLAKGADRAIRIWDDALAEQPLLDVATKATLLAAVVEAESPDLVLTGVQTGDEAFGGTGVSLADTVNYGWAAVVNSLEIDADAGTASVHRELEGGVEELTDIDLPAVLTIQTGINEPRYASLRGIRQAQSADIAVHTVADLGVDPTAVQAALDLTELAEPVAEGEARYLEGAPGEQATQLAEILRDRGVGST